MTDDRRPKLLTPTSANPLTVLIAGGPADIARELRAWLAPRGLRVANHWPSDKSKTFGRPIPAGTDLTIILCRHLGHSACDAVVAACKRAGVRRVLTVWNRSRLTADLERAGVKLAAPRPAFDPTPTLEEADTEQTRCVFSENGRRCQQQASTGDTLCVAHRQAFEASRSSASSAVVMVVSGADLPRPAQAAADAAPPTASAAAPPPASAAPRGQLAVCRARRRRM
jgi:hypothetical protein